MRMRSLPGRIAVATCGLIWIVLAALATPPQRSLALPVYARRYNVPCEACHTVAPALNATGLAFQANHFNWVGGPPRSRSGLALIPVSGIGKYDSFEGLTDHQTSSGFQTLQLFLSDGFNMGTPGTGGYLFDYFAYVNGGPAGALENAFVSAPVAGPNGRLALTIGQFSPMMYQYDQADNLTQSLPDALTQSVDGLDFADVHPGAELDYFSNRGGGTADGDYLSVGVPFAGNLDANQYSQVDGPHGVFLHAFRRERNSSFGVFGFDGAGNSIAGALGTYQWRSKVYLLAAGQVSRDQFGHSQVGSAEADYFASSQFALTGRLETMSGEESATYPVLGATYYPFRPQLIRLEAETTQERANRSFTVYVFGQF